MGTRSGRDRLLTREPWRAYERLRRGSPVVYLPSRRAHFLFRHEAVAQAFASRDLSATQPFRTSRRLFGPTILDNDGDDHERLRAVFTRPLRPSHVEQYKRDIVVPLVDGLLEEAAGSGRTLDLVAEVATPLPMLVLTSLLGLPRSDQPHLTRLVAPLRDGLDHDHVDQALARQSARLVREYLAARVSSGELGGALGEPLLDAVRAGEVDTAELLANLALLLLGGTATTTCAIACATARIVSEAAAWEAVCRGTLSVDAAVQEALRLEPPLRFTPRFANREVVLGSARIPAGAVLQLCVASANRDGTAYADPGAFLPGRAGPAPLTFGRGLHSCIGAFLGSVETVAVVEALAARRVVVTSSGRLEPGWTFRRPARVEVSFTDAGRPARPRS